MGTRALTKRLSKVRSITVSIARMGETMLVNRSMPRCTVIPELPYPDVAEATAWLCETFGSHCDCESETTVRSSTSASAPSS